jgi:hypothetical protein
MLRVYGNFIEAQERRRYALHKSRERSSFL